MHGTGCHAVSATIAKLVAARDPVALFLRFPQTAPNAEPRRAGSAPGFVPDDCHRDRGGAARRRHAP